MKQWPKGDEPASPLDLASQIVRAIRFAYTLKRRNKDKDIKLTGPDAPESEDSGLTGSQCLTAKYLNGYAASQNIDPLEMIIMVALRIGAEQGRRIVKTRSLGDIFATMGLKLPSANKPVAKATKEIKPKVTVAQKMKAKRAAKRLR